MPRPAGSGRKSKAKHAGGRPTTFSKELAEAIFARIAQGEGLKRICQAEDMPGERTVYGWLRRQEHAEFRQMYARAREDQQEHWADEIIEIADNGANDVNQARLRIDTRKWLMAKLAPRKYGDFKTLEHTGQVEVHVKRITLVDKAAPKKQAKVNSDLAR